MRAVPMKRADRSWQGASEANSSLRCQHWGGHSRLRQFPAQINRRNISGHFPHVQVMKLWNLKGFMESLNLHRTGLEVWREMHGLRGEDSWGMRRMSRSRSWINVRKWLQSNPSQVQYMNTVPSVWLYPVIWRESALTSQPRDAYTLEKCNDAAE